MSPEQIAELRRLEGDAFEAPWALDRGKNGDVRAIASVRDGPLGYQYVFGPEGEPPLLDDDSAALVVAMRNALLRLLDEREALLEALRGLLKWPSYTDSRLEAELAVKKAESP